MQVVTAHDVYFSDETAGKAIDADEPAMILTAERERIHGAGLSHSGYGADSIEKAPVDGGALSGSLVAFGRGKDHRGENTIGVETGTGA